MALDRNTRGLTERRIRDAKPESKARILWDDTVKGLGVRVTPAGAKSYILNYRVAGRERRATLARCSEINLKAARERAGSELAAIRAGEADPLQRRRAAREAPTVAELVEQFFAVEAPARIARGRMKPGTVETYGYQARTHILPAIGKRRVVDVTRADVERMVAPLPSVTRNRVLALTSGLFRLAETWGSRPHGTNPTRGVERAREEARDRTLAPSELAALAAALSDAEARFPANVAAIRFAAVTGLRIGEVLAVRWEHIDFESGRLLLPETKTGRRWHDLPSPALAILADLPRFGAWTFTNTGGRSPATYKRVRQCFARVAAAAGLEDVRLHDLRRTVMTRAAMAGVGTHVLRDLLGHKTTQMADRYVRALADPVREARETVGAEMAAMMEGKAGDVVPVRGRNG
ncbi:MAG: tyrosine-type recombinase/integrase [Rhodospirillales bacterium]|nr:tyrosine-type recombinase/integrase [Rhodospirillales bacterium]